MRLFRTYHRKGVVHLCWNCDSTLILSVGIVDHSRGQTSFNLQVTDALKNEVLSVRNLGLGCPYEVLAHPRQFNRFATVGIEKIVLWELQYRSLVRSNIVNVSETFLTCACFLMYPVEGQEVIDLLCGTKIGDLGVMTSGRFIILKEKAHQKTVNCLKVLAAKEEVIITAGEDETIHFWNKWMVKICSIELRQSELWCDLRGEKERVSEISKDRNYSVTSLDYYQCRGSSTLLVSTRAGDIIETHFGKAEEKWKSAMSVKKREKEEVEEEGFWKNYRMILLVR